MPDRVEEATPGGVDLAIRWLSALDFLFSQIGDSYPSVLAGPWAHYMRISGPPGELSWGFAGDTKDRGVVTGAPGPRKKSDMMIYSNEGSFSW